MSLSAFRLGSSQSVKVIVDVSINCGFAGSLSIRVSPNSTVTQLTADVLRKIRRMSQVTNFLDGAHYWLAADASGKEVSSADICSGKIKQVHLIRVVAPNSAVDTSKDGTIARLQSENLHLSEKLIEVEYYQKSQQGQAFQRMETDLAKANIELANARATVDELQYTNENLLLKLQAMQTTIKNLKKQPCSTCIHMDTMRTRLAQLEEQVSLAIVPANPKSILNGDTDDFKWYESFTSAATSHPFDSYFTKKYGNRLSRRTICESQ